MRALFESILSRGSRSVNIDWDKQILIDKWQELTASFSYMYAKDFSPITNFDKNTHTIYLDRVSYVPAEFIVFCIDNGLNNIYINNSQSSGNVVITNVQNQGVQIDSTNISCGSASLCISGNKKQIELTNCQLSCTDTIKFEETFVCRNCILTAANLECVGLIQPSKFEKCKCSATQIWIYDNNKTPAFSDTLIRAGVVLRGAKYRINPHLAPEINCTISDILDPAFEHCQFTGSISAVHYWTGDWMMFVKKYGKGSYITFSNTIRPKYLPHTTDGYYMQATAGKQYMQALFRGKI